MIKEVPLKPLETFEKHNLAAAIKDAKHGSAEWHHNLAILWIHLGLEIGIKPYDSRTKGTPSWRKVESLWAPAAAKVLGACSHALSAGWSEPISALAARLYERAVRNRSAATQGTFQPLFAED